MRNPYTIAEEQPGAEFYMALPYPFNVPPRESTSTVKDFRKLEAVCPKFTGNEADFYAWAFMFVPTIHTQNCPVYWKTSLLIKCLDTDNPRLKELTNGIGQVGEDYARLLRRLVLWFGHPRGILAARMQALEEVTRVCHDDLRMMERIYIRLEDYCEITRQLGRTNDLASHQLYDMVFFRLDEELRQRYLTWTRWRACGRDVLTLLAWLGEALIDTREIYRNMRVVPKANQEHVTLMVTGGQGGREACLVDGGGHDVEDCQTFQEMSPEERRKMARDLQICFRCLSKKHVRSECQSSVACTYCPRDHHPLLHFSKNIRYRRRRDNPVENVTAEEQASFNAVATEQSRKVQLQTTPVILTNSENKKTATTNVVMDTGSTISFISVSLAKILQLRGRATVTNGQKLGEKEVEHRATFAMLQIAAVSNPRRKFWLHVKVMEDPALSYTPYDWTKTKGQFDHLRDIPMENPAPGPVGLLIGMDVAHLLMSITPDRMGTSLSQPVARLTRLGWVIGGPVGVLTENETRPNTTVAMFTKEWSAGEVSPWETYKIGEDEVCHAFKEEENIKPLSKTKETELNVLVERMWEVEAVPKRDTPDILEQSLMEKLRSELTMEKGKYVLPTLWKKGEPNLPNNYNAAMKRLRSLNTSKHFKKNTTKAAYLGCLDGWVRKGYVEKVETSTPGKDRAYYLPHFPVVKEDRLTTKVRVVLDGRDRTAGKSLNDAIHKGPKLINELPGVFLRFRARRFCIAADIKEMFHQIKLKEEDRDFHRFLWPTATGTDVYRWAVHPFGSTASPCIAIFTIKEHAARWKHEYPRAADTVIFSTLVDDNLDSCNTEKETIELGMQLKALFAEAGMEIRKFISNSQQILEAFPEQDRSPSLDIAAFCQKDLQLPLVKTLGVIYLADEDAFSFMIEKAEVKVWTKRAMLRYEAQLYDPHGFIAPITVKARMLLQDSWREKVGWDQVLPEPILNQWNKWLAVVERLPELRIPRCLFDTDQEDPEKQEFHLFSDASSSAYAIAVYCVSIHPNKNRTSRLVFARSRVAPLHQTSIPRLELMGAALATEALEALRVVFPIRLNDCYCWTDSTNVLAWLRADSRTLQTFVGQRVATMQKVIGAERWFWVDTKNNPADLPSRGTTTLEDVETELWRHGPKFLTTGKDWPVMPAATQIPKEVLKEVKKGTQFALNVQSTLTDTYDPELDTFPVKSSRWQSLVKITAFCMRITSSYREHFVGREEFEKAEKVVVRQMQKSCFARTWRDLIDTGASPGGKLAHLFPMIDVDGCLRVRARLRQAVDIPYESRCQLIIPKDHPFTDCLIRYVHESVVMHGGAKHTAAVLMKKFWIVKGNRKVRDVVARCVVCKRQRASPTDQVMAPLPEERIPVERLSPFTHTALDMAGPFHVKWGRNGVKKMYVLLFTCRTVRAIHLEALTDSTTEAFLMAFDRFTARRGRPRTVYCDNGTNFVGAHNQLINLWSQIDLMKLERKDGTLNGLSLHPLDLILAEFMKD